MLAVTPDSTQSELIAAVREVMEQEILPLVIDMDRRGDDTFDWTLVRIAARHNLLAPGIPREYGGRGLSYLDTALVLEEVAAVCPGLAAVIATIAHAAAPLILAGTTRQKEEFLPLLTGPEPGLAAFALTEPGGGSDLDHMKTTATTRDDYYILNGVKDYVINGAVSRFVTVCARRQESLGMTGLEFFLVTPDQFQVSAVRNKMGLRYAHTVQLTFSGSRVPATHMVGQTGNGYLLLTQTMDYGRALVGALEVGIARASYQLALNYAHEREQFGRPIFSNQGISFALADMATAIDAARLLTWRACTLIDNGLDCSREASMAKLCASEVAQRVASRAVDILGARGYTMYHPVNIYFRDAKAGGIGEGTNNIQRMVIASLL